MIYLKLIRINNWVKNSFIFIPLFFSSQIIDLDKFFITLIITFGFSLVTSFVYILNDIFDLEFDLNHPVKKYRPIASGLISIKFSIAVAIINLIIGLVLIGWFSINALLITIFYVLYNIAYSIKLKHIPIIDFIVVAFGFVLRIIIGGEICDIILSHWIILLIFCLALFIAITKRRDDVYQFHNKERINRKVIDKYNVEFMDICITIISSVLIVSYLLFITSHEVIERYHQSNFLFITFIPVLIGILRYNQIIYVYGKGGSPIDILYNDLFLQLTLLFWIILFFIIIYGNQIF